jgi:hypothetical protein
MRGAKRSSAGSLLGSWTLELCLGKEGAWASIVVEKCFIIESTEISSFCKNSLGNTIGAQKTASDGERPVSSLHCVPESEEYKG